MADLMLESNEFKPLQMRRHSNQLWKQCFLLLVALSP